MARVVLELVLLHVDVFLKVTQEISLEEKIEV